MASVVSRPSSPAPPAPPSSRTAVNGEVLVPRIRPSRTSKRKSRADSRGDSVKRRKTAADDRLARVFSLRDSAVMHPRMLGSFAGAHELPLLQQPGDSANDPTIELLPWPEDVELLHDFSNPLGIRFSYHPSYGQCGCETRCSVETCRNARLSLHCTRWSCSMGGGVHCGNRLQESGSVCLTPTASGRAGVSAVLPIPAGEILGEYFGELTLLAKNPTLRVRNGGFMLKLKTPSCCGEVVGVDASKKGGLMRFVNHSCEPNACFYEVVNRRRPTVIVVATQPIANGEEVTVDYGNDLWFVCRCGSSACRHREIQCENDP